MIRVPVNHTFSLSHAYTLTLTHAHAHSLSLTHTYTLSLSLSHTHTHTHTLLQGMEVPDIARKYYVEDNPYLFDKFCTVKDKDGNGDISVPTCNHK